MSGLEQIIDTINTQGQSIADSITQAAKTQAEEIIAEAKARASETEEEIISAARQQCERNLDNAQSGAQALVGKKLLSVKVDAVYEVINAAADRIRNLSDDVYFETMAALIAQNVEADGGCVYFSEKDTARMPANFEKTVNNRLGGKFTVTVSQKPADIADGFVIRFGDIEENCTVNALTEANSDALKDTVAHILFD